MGLFFQGLLGKGTGFCGVAHNGKYCCGRHSSTLFLQLDQQELLEHRNNAIGCYTKTFRLTALAQQDTREQQDTQPDSRIHGWTTGYVAGLQDTQPNSRIRGWTSGCTAKQQDTRLDYRIHNQTAGYTAGLQDTQPDTGYVDTSWQQHLTAAGTRDRPIGREPKPRCYFGSLLAATTGTDENSC